MGYLIFMKTTIDLADDLTAKLKRKTVQDGISMRAAFHEALRLWLKRQPAKPKPQTIRRDVGLMSGRGLTPEAASLSWDEMRSLSYDQRG